MAYLRLKDTARIQKLDSGVSVTELFHSKSSLESPLAGIFLSLCQGDMSYNDIINMMLPFFGMDSNKADYVVDIILQRTGFALDIYDHPMVPNRRYNPLEFAFEPVKLPDNRRLSAPTSVSLTLTQRCNFKCIYCYNNSGYSQQGELTPAQWIDAIHQIQDMGVQKILLTGGEPTMKEGFIDILREAVKRETLVTLFTNGYALTDENIKEFSSYPNLNIQISLDVPKADLHHKLTNTSQSYNQVVKNIYKMGSSGANICVKGVMLPENYSYAEDLIKLCMDAGVKRLTLDHYDFTCTGRGNFDFDLTREQNQEIQKVVEKYSEIYSVTFSEGNSVHIWKLPEDCVICDAGTREFNLSPLGEYAFCERLQGIEQYIIGKFPDMSIRELWEDHGPEKIIHPDISVYDKTCKTCEYFEKCRSGCFADKLVIKGMNDNLDNTYKPDPKCPKSHYDDNPFQKGM